MKRLLIYMLGCLFYISANAETAKIEGTTNVEDAQIEESTPDRNYGGETLFRVNPAIEWASLIRVKNLATIIGAGATITNAVCSVYCEGYNNDMTISAYSVFKPWNEGTSQVTCVSNFVSWNDWDCTVLEWTTAGCNNADDAGSDNSGDGINADRKATAESSINVTAIGWYVFDISNALAQAWYDGTKNEEGLLLKGSTGPIFNNTFSSTESATASQRPFFVFTYTPPSSGQKVMLKK